ncbi:MAG: apolipoprotein N-acyltransferase [Waddliaceae bacterium]|nr:apolipoprotein N-acyltransferase [Waddliaceae bacterium]MBT3578663.1 apolipoprotein N-acyltransferase [Waddliaceae bacterium]MBT4445382.1 apolipoprotein N-acyltransferase [Waddliaceae bacterium]MBT6928350.1 apolipoprotein N-acyltransferase [Waddliaceae bacterium]MBT7265036.1 apolipoprotein N-acyltransferase [Waddliaceae bacterium]
MRKASIVVISFVVVAFGQPAWVPWLGLVAAVCGYALLWRSLSSVGSKKRRFFVASSWFCCVQLIQLSWMTSIEYVGGGLIVAYLLLSIMMGLQFGVVSFFVEIDKKVRTFLIVPALWVLMEWMRLFLFSGFTFNPVGLSFAGSIYPLQMASLFGVYGLSFVVIATNILVFFSISAPKKILSWAIVGIFVVTPFIFGFFHLNDGSDGDDAVSVVLVQTALTPEEKYGLCRGDGVSLSPYDQWLYILSYLEDSGVDDADFIIFPENTVPLGVSVPAYRYDEVVESLRIFFGDAIFAALPPLSEPYYYEGGRLVSNSFWAQSLANVFGADVIVGLEDVEGYDVYTSAVVFVPGGASFRRYDKRILLPMGEYIPFTFLESLARRFGVEGSFSRGVSGRVFDHDVMPYSVSICYEETFGNIIRQDRRDGAKLLINITNDVWYPNSRLRLQHFHHGRLRSVENGVPLVRACNTGVTGVVDNAGRVQDTFGEGRYGEEWRRGALVVSVPISSYDTLYSRYGDWLIVVVSFIMLCVGMLGIAYRKSG